MKSFESDFITIRAGTNRNPVFSMNLHIIDKHLHVNIVFLFQMAESELSDYMYSR